MPTAPTQKEIIRRVQDEVSAALLSGEEKFIRKWLRTLKRLERELTGRVAEAFSDWTEDGDAWSYLELRALGRDSILLSDVRDAVENAKKELTSALGEKMREHAEEASARGAWALDITTPPDVAIAFAARVPDPHLQALVAMPYREGYFSDRIGHITETMFDDVKEGLVQSMLNGEGIKDAAARVRKAIGAPSDLRKLTFAERRETGAKAAANRAEMIARTELLRASNIGLRKTYADNEEVLDGEEWYTARDDRACPECAAMDGLSVPDETDGEQPPLHPNCRCAVVPRPKKLSELLDLGEEGLELEEGPGVMAFRDEEGDTQIGRYESFEHWMEERS